MSLQTISWKVMHGRPRFLFSSGTRWSTCFALLCMPRSIFICFSEGFLSCTSADYRQRSYASVLVYVTKCFVSSSHCYLACPVSQLGQLEAWAENEFCTQQRLWSPYPFVMWIFAVELCQKWLWLYVVVWIYWYCMCMSSKWVWNKTLPHIKATYCHYKVVIWLLLLLVIASFCTADYVYLFYAAEGSLLLVCLSMCLCTVHAWSYTKSLLARYLTNLLWEFHHIYNLGAVGYNWLDVEVQRSWWDQIWSKRHFESFEGQGFTDSHSGKGVPVDGSLSRIICM